MMTNLTKSASNTYKSNRRLLQKLEKQFIRDLKLRLPNEIIMKIISFLDSPKDIKNCMMICKETRTTIFSKQECMRKFEFNLNDMLIDWRQGIEFLQVRGKGIRNFRYELFIGSRPLMRLVLNQMPNLEELRFEKKKIWLVKDKKDAVHEDFGEDDDFSANNDDRDKLNGHDDDKTDLKRKKPRSNGCLDGKSGENGKFGENGEFGENNEFSENGEFGRKDGFGEIGKNGNIDKNDRFDNKIVLSKTKEPSNKMDQIIEPTTTLNTDPTNSDNHSDSDNGFNSELETEDDNDSDDDSYKESIHSSDDDESSIDAESVGEVEIHSDESSDEFSSDEEDLDAAKEPARLSKLKNLKINLEDLQDFVDNSKDVKAVEKLSVTLSEFENEEVLVTFLNNQVNLKELELVKHKRLKELNLPTAQNPKFNINLKKLKVKLDCRNYENLANFMISQVDSLEELEFSVGLYRNTENFINFFLNAVNLTTLTLREGIAKFIGNIDDLRLENVKYFDQKNQSMDLDTIYSIFPNLETLKCFSTSSITVSNPKLTSLELKNCDLNCLRFTALPNLKNFTVTMNLKNVNEESWTHFAGLCHNIENLSIQTYDYEFSNDQSQQVKSLCILENLRLLPKLQNVSYKTMAMPRRISEFQCAAVDTELVKIDINVEKKVAKVSQFLAQNHRGTLIKLLNDFEGFTFHEIRADEPKKIKIDPRMFVGGEEPAAKRQKESED
ncbi:unnamed protein product [Chironomus riparius]|uniref:F-box domain-containing protein n=1 Tax=Chironomus riparius TaxID=315576 RepID=A0A9N9S6Z0_9DIPT|nr:unnamed protein product [Chironomus riparius]